MGMRYAMNFPLAGLLRLNEYGRLQSDSDERRKVQFGNYTQIWVPQEETAHTYLSALYGKDWRTALRQRDGPATVHGNPGIGQLVHKDESKDGSVFWGLFAQPSGPVRDIVSELRALGALTKK